MKNMITHKRVRVTSERFYVFFPFGVYLSKGFVTKDIKEVEKAISRENKLTYTGLSGLFVLYVLLHDNKDLWVGLFFVLIAVSIFCLLHFSAKTSFLNPENYNQELHGTINT